MKVRHAGPVAVASACATLLFESFAYASDFQFTRLVDTSTAVPGGAFGNFTSVNLVAVDGPKIAFFGQFQLGQTTYSGLYQSINGQLSTIADLSVGAPSGGNFQQIFSGNDYITGNLVFGARTEDGIGIFRFNGSSVATVFAPGTTLPHGGTLASLEGKGVSGDATIAAFTGTNGTGTHSLNASKNGQHSFLADEDTRVPGIELGLFHSFPEIHSRGNATLFVGTALDPDAELQIFEPAGIFRVVPGFLPESMVTRSTIIPDEPDLYFKEFENPRIGADGRFYFTGGFLNKEETPAGGAPAGPPDHFMGVFSTDRFGNLITIADSEMALPELHADIEEFNRYSLDEGVKVFGVNDETGVSYLYVQDADGTFHHILDSTEVFDGKQLTQLRMTLDPTGNGVTSFRAVFADGSTGVYSVVVPEPASGLVVALSSLTLCKRRRS